MKLWQQAWRSIAPSLPTLGLEALAKALQDDDPRLLQGVTTMPPPLQCVQDWPIEAACALGFCGWQGENRETVGEVEEFFARMCYTLDQNMGEPAGCRWFLNWYDETPRDEMRAALLEEVTLELKYREAKLCVTS